MNKKLLVIIGVVVIVVAWFLFRPEKLIINKNISENFPQEKTTNTSVNTSKVLFSGRFHGVAHETKGDATIYALPDGNKVLRLTNFATSNGPDVRVFLVAANDSSDSETVKNAGFVELGALKGNIGDQNYDIPADLDLGKYKSVTIWCNRFSVNFGTAPLSEI